MAGCEQGVGCEKLARRRKDQQQGDRLQQVGSSQNLF